MRVRPARSGEGGRLRELRLRALRDAPDAFSSDPGREQAFDSAVWEQRGRTVVVAEDGEQWLGMAGWHADDDLPAIARVWGVWVDERARGRGVTDRAPAAEALYERLGFRRTGVTLWRAAQSQSRRLK